MTTDGSMLTLAEVEALARTAHEGQTDKAGRPYAEHLAAVAEGVRARGGSAEQQAAAWLHDSIEDEALSLTWLDSAALAGAHHLKVLPHYYKEYDVPLACTIPHASGVESFDWVDGLVDRPVRIENGYAYPSDVPGWGFRFKDEPLREFGA